MTTEVSKWQGLTVLMMMSLFVTNVKNRQWSKTKKQVLIFQNMISNDPGGIGQQPGYKAKNNRQLQYEATAHYYRQDKINKVTKTKATAEQTHL